MAPIPSLLYTAVCNNENNNHIVLQNTFETFFEQEQE
jgi:hypothetical protein